ncbi:MAG TPA: MazG nucleotide pyrophosphohydrolase domain-containing protein [Candidatus Saccharimonadales bacterium]|nr:MazG nucleotide pyrophosphohydrolase domain-containing protein [Candidatus Saccharimonadales bacterium]
MSNTDLTLKDLQKHLEATCRERGWDQRSITECFLLFSEEIGELAKAIRKETGIKGEARPEDSRDNLRGEFADVLNYLLELANRFDVDLTEAYFEKNAINQKRTWN